MFIQRVINGINLGYFFLTSSGLNYHVGVMTRYYNAGDQLQIRVVPSANVNINVNAENVASESPLIHIVQLTGAV